MRAPRCRISTKFARVGAKKFSEIRSTLDAWKAGANVQQVNLLFQDCDRDQYSWVAHLFQRKMRGCGSQDITQLLETTTGNHLPIGN
jgi:hypothetical protein